MKIRSDHTQDTKEVRMMDTQALQGYLSMGYNRAVQFGKEAGAARYIGRRLLFDRKILDEALDRLTD